MTEHRPPPQYGEYATPEEQAKAIGVPVRQEHHATPTSEARPPHSRRQDAPLPQSDGAHPRRDDTARPRVSRDRIVTVVLLGLGLAWVLTSIPGSANLSTTIQSTYELQGYTGHYGPVALATMLGLIMNISSIAVWGITCAVSILLMRRRRKAWYVPVIGAFIAGIIALVLVIIAMVSDPGLVAYLNSQHL